MCLSGRMWTLLAVLLCLPLSDAYAEGDQPTEIERQSDDEVEEPDLREPEPEYFIAIVGKPVKIERLDRERFGNLIPWSIASYADFDKKCMARCVPEGPACWKLCARERKNRDTDDIVISNSCGFMRTTYETVTFIQSVEGELNFTQQMNFVIYNTIGEWCRLRNLVHDADDGLVLGRWGGSYYKILDFVPLKGSDNGWFLSPSIFAEEQRGKIEHLFAPISNDQKACFEPDRLWPDERTDLERSKFAHRNKDGKLCETHGLPISRALTAYRIVGDL